MWNEQIFWVDDTAVSAFLSFFGLHEHPDLIDVIQQLGMIDLEKRECIPLCITGTRRQPDNPD
jgi:hypothetical protein